MLARAEHMLPWGNKVSPMYGTRRSYGDRGGLGGGGADAVYVWVPAAAAIRQVGVGVGCARMQSHAHPSRAAWTDRSASPSRGANHEATAFARSLDPAHPLHVVRAAQQSLSIGSASALHVVSMCWQSRADHASDGPRPMQTLRLSPLGRRKGKADSKLPGTPQPRGESTTPSGGGDLRNRQPTTDHDRFHHSQLR
jgi:hypothetical protein